MEVLTAIGVQGRCMLQWPQGLEHAERHLIAMVKHVVEAEPPMIGEVSAGYEFTVALAMISGLVVSCAMAIWLRPAPDNDLEVSEPAAQSLAPGSADKRDDTADVAKADLGPIQAYALTSIQLAYGFSLALQGLLVAPLEAERLWPESASLAVGSFAAITAVAQLIGPEVGHFSDTYRSPWGRRRPIILVSGTAVASLTVGLWYFSLVRGRVAYIITLQCQQIGWNVIMSTQAGLAPDVVPEELLGFSGAAGAANILIGAFISFVAMANLTFLEYHWFYCIQASILLACMILVCALANEKSSLDHPRDDCKTVAQWLSRVQDHYTFDWRAYPDFSLLLATKTIYCASVVVKAFLFFFVQDTFNLKSQPMQVELLTKCAVGAEVGAAGPAIITMLLVGKDSPNRSKRALWAVIGGSAWMGVMWNVCSVVGYRAHQVGDGASPGWSVSLIPWFIFGTTIWGFGQGAYLAGDQALSLNLLPDPDQASRYLAFSSICAFVGTAVGGISAGSLLAFLGGGQKKGYSYIGYMSIFTFAVVLSWILAIVASHIRARDPDDKLEMNASDSPQLETKS